MSGLRNRDHVSLVRAHYLVGCDQRTAIVVARDARLTWRALNMTLSQERDYALVQVSHQRLTLDGLDQRVRLTKAQRVALKQTGLAVLAW